MIESLCSGQAMRPIYYQDYQYAAHILQTSDFNAYRNQIKIALLTEGEDLAPYQKFRDALYLMQYNSSANSFIDLGGYKGGEAGLAELIDFLDKQDILTIVIGQSPFIPKALLDAHSRKTYPIKMASANSSLDWGTEEKPSLLKTLLKKHPGYLAQLNCMGYQSYFVDPQLLSYLEQQLFETYRLGKLQEQMYEVEPMLRNVQAFAFDLSAIAAVHAPASSNPNPNGFTAKEACQIMRYAGMSDLLNQAALYTYEPEADDRGLSAILMAQMVWYLVEGYQQRVGEAPPALEQLTRYELQLPVGQLPVSFFKSTKTDRWWFHVFEEANQLSLDQIDPLQLEACSYQDYLMTCEGDVPERLLMALQR